MYKRQSRQDQYFCEVPCAYHSESLITNFCSHPDCLLPLCPRCISIHNEEHVKMGHPSSFEPIEECARTVLRELSKRFNQAVTHDQAIDEKIRQFKRSAAVAVGQVQEHAQTLMVALQKQLQFMVINLTKLIKDQQSNFVTHMLTLQQELRLVAQDYDILRNELFTDKFLSGIIGFYNEERTDPSLFDHKISQGAPDIVVRVNYDRLGELKDRVKHGVILDFIGAQAKGHRSKASSNSYVSRGELILH